MKPVPERLAAKAAGEKLYRTDKICQNGHQADRYTSTGKCTECTAASHQRFVSDPVKRAKRNSRASAWKSANRALVNKTTKAWRDKNPDKNSEYCKNFRKAHPETARNLSKRWAAANRHKRPIYMANWERKNPERATAVRRASKINRRASERANGGRCSGDDIDALFRKQKGKCAGCLKKTKKLELDHIIAVANGGSSDPSNIQLLCGPCNRSKSDRDAIEWAQEKHGRLF